MSKLTAWCLPAAMACFLAGCATPQICTREIKKSDPAAKALVTASQRAHGQKAFTKMRDVSVRHEGSWASIGPRFQPVLADTKFRRGSEERLLIGAHVGPYGCGIEGPRCRAHCAPTG